MRNCQDSEVLRVVRARRWPDAGMSSCILGLISVFFASCTLCDKKLIALEQSLTAGVGAAASVPNKPMMAAAALGVGAATSGAAVYAGGEASAPTEVSHLLIEMCYITLRGRGGGEGGWER